MYPELGDSKLAFQQLLDGPVGLVDAGVGRGGGIGIGDHDRAETGAAEVRWGSCVTSAA